MRCPMLPLINMMGVSINMMRASINATRVSINAMGALLNTIGVSSLGPVMRVCNPYGGFSVMRH